MSFPNGRSTSAGTCSDCCVAGTSSNFTRVRSLSDAEQEADHQVAPEQPGELRNKFGRTACEQSGLLGLTHNFPQGGAAGLSSCRVERSRHFRGVARLGDRQPEYCDDRRIAYLAEELRPKRSQDLRQGLAIARHGHIGGDVQSLGAFIDTAQKVENLSSRAGFFSASSMLM